MTAACADLKADLPLRGHDLSPLTRLKRNAMAWSTPTLVEICIGLEINGYLPPEF